MTDKQEEQGRPEEPDSRPIRYRLLCESDVDGFPQADPDFAAYCPVEGRKLRTASHAVCEYFAGYLYSASGEETGIRCMCPECRKPHS
jgi:hypothetical protein